MPSLFTKMRALVLTFLFAAGAAWADYTTTLQTLAVTNHTGYVIDADAFKLGAPARSVVAGSVSILYKRAGGVIGLPESVTYTLTWSLVDGNDQAQALDTGGTSFDTTQVVNWPGGISELALTSTVNLNPAARLDFKGTPGNSKSPSNMIKEWRGAMNCGKEKRGKFHSFWQPWTLR